MMDCLGSGMRNDRSHLVARTAAAAAAADAGKDKAANPHSSNVCAVHHAGTFLLFVAN